jgi:hypothetical protein
MASKNILIKVLSSFFPGINIQVHHLDFIRRGFRNLTEINWSFGYRIEMLDFFGSSPI